MNLKEQLAAKKAAEDKKNEGALPANSELTVAEVEAIIQAAEAVNELVKISEIGLAAAAESTKPTEKQPEPDYSGPQFRKGSFAYQFKYSKGTIKCDKAGIYTPQTAEEFEILKHQVLRGNILFN